jgi:predicted ATPase
MVARGAGKPDRDGMEVIPRLQAIRYEPPKEADAFPFSIPALRSLSELPLDAPVTLFVGENGSGKSTVLEALAIAAGLATAGSHEARRDETLADQRRLAARFKLVWARRLTRGFFLRAEDFFGYVARLRRTRAEVHEELARIDRDPQMVGMASDDVARLRGAVGSVLGTTYAPDGRDYDHRSHGESFLTFFRERLQRRGLYLLDEPEAALSPQSQLGLLVMIRDALAEGSQFLIATHSPILMACPGSLAISFDQTPPGPVSFDDLESVRLYRDFLAAPERYLRHL